MIDYYSPELIDKILLCVPQKPRSMFKCVSKLWCDIINHINDNLVPPSGLVLFSYQPGTYLAGITTLFDVEGDGKSFQVLHSFDIPAKIPMLLASQNGLLLLRNTIGSDDTRFFFCNPAVRDDKDRYVVLPRPENPIKPWHEAGFMVEGGSSSSDKFRVVCFKLNAQSIGAGKVKCYIFSSEDAKWKEHETIIRKPLQQLLGFREGSTEKYYRKTQPVSLCYKRKLHWLYKQFVVIYDFDKNFFEIINLPYRHSKNKISRGLLYESQGILYYCKSYPKRLVVWAYLRKERRHGSDEENYYWKMKESILYKEKTVVPEKQNEEWSEDEDEEPNQKVGSSPHVLCPMAFNEDLQTLYLHRRRAIYSYSFKTRKLMVLWSFPPSDNGYRETWVGFPYSV